MRALIIITIVPTILMAAPATFNVGSVASSSKGTTLINPDRTDDLSSNTFSIEANTGSTISKFTELRVGYTRKKVDYNNYTIRDANGTTSSLADTFDKPEHLYSLGTSLNIKSFQLTLDAQSSTGESPFKEKNVTTAISYSSYKSGSNLKLGWYQRKSNRPVSTINDPDTFKPRLLSGELNERQYFLEYEQILSERLKVKVVPKFNSETEDRPVSYGTDIQAGYALFDELAVLTSASYFQEDTSRPAPAIGTGYYSLRSVGGGLTYEPIYNVFLRGFYNLTIEEETPRGRNPRQTVGTDSYLLGVIYRKKDIEAEISIQLDRSNTNAQSDAISGGLTWNL